MQRRGVAPVIWAGIGVIIAVAIVLTFIWHTPAPMPQAVAQMPVTTVRGPCTSAFCLIDAAKTCAPTTYAWNQTFVTSKGNVTLAKTIEIMGMSNGACSVDVRIGQALYGPQVPAASVTAFLSTKGGCTMPSDHLAANLKAAIDAGRFTPLAVQECKGFAGTFS